ncbi:MAG: cytochrome c biogenesis CcdA family protein [Actinomycetota bacterium]
MQLAPLAFLAGVLSIVTPCILPLIPGYLSYISGVSAGSPERKRVMGSALLFVLGFALIFTALGLSASLIGGFLLGQLPLLLKIAGVAVIVMGLSMLGILRIPFLMKEKRMDFRKVRPGPLGALPLGMAFAFGWTPCIGPILGGVLGLAGATQTAWKGALLLAIYSLGMAVPFLLMALAYTRAGATFRFLTKHALGIERTGGGLLVVMGVLLVTGYWNRLFYPLIGIFSRNNWLPPI